MTNITELAAAVRRLEDAAGKVQSLGENIPCVVCNINLIMAHLEMLNAEVEISAVVEGVGEYEYAVV